MRKRYAAERNVRPVEQFSRHEAPDGVRYGDTPARPSRMPIVTFLAIAPYKAVMRDDFWISILNPANRRQTLHGLDGGAETWDQRVNIHKGGNEAFGDLVTLSPHDAYAAQNPFLK